MVFFLQEGLAEDDISRREVGQVAPNRSDAEHALDERERDAEREYASAVKHDYDKPWKVKEAKENLDKARKR